MKSRSFRLCWRFVCSAFLVGALLGPCLALSAAPAPLPRPVKKAAPPALSFLGTWGMRWGSGSTTAVTFDPDGNYWCDWYGTRWVGAWELHGATLIVRDWRHTDSYGPMAPSEWSVDLDETGKAGTLSRGGVFVLVRHP